MIKVLREGTKKKVECENCGALLQYEKEDIQKQQTSFSGFYDYIVCPECQLRVELKGTR